MRHSEELLYFCVKTSYISLEVFEHVREGWDAREKNEHQKWERKNILKQESGTGFGRLGGEKRRVRGKCCIV